MIVGKRRTRVVPELWPCKECGQAPILYRHGETSVYFQCPHGHHRSKPFPTLAQARSEWNERFGRARQKIPSEAELVEALRGDNPHGLTPCACGEIPRPVAYARGVWYWGVECAACDKLSYGHQDLSRAIGYWGNGDYRTPNDDVGARRYDLPTSLTLGCAELPEEYR